MLLFSLNTFVFSSSKNFKIKIYKALYFQLCYMVVNMYIKVEMQAKGI